MRELYLMKWIVVAFCKQLNDSSKSIISEYNELFMLMFTVRVFFNVNTTKVIKQVVEETFITIA